MADFDLTIIGGGINGTALARDAAGRGLRVLLVERGDLGAGTSAATTKLIHGGLRYLEHGALRLVQEGLRERAILLKTAPHIVWPARFVLPHHAGMRPEWQLRLGLFLYDLLGGNRLLPGTRSLALSRDPVGVPLKSVFSSAFEYSDCGVDDARLVVLNAVDAADRGAEIRPRTEFKRAERRDGMWLVHLRSRGEALETTSGALVNAAGPWIEGVNETMPPEVLRSKVRLVKGSHIVVKKLFDHGKCYLFQNTDGRIVFAIPYHNDFTLIGTTDEDFSGDPARAEASPAEIDYLCAVTQEYFRTPIRPADVVWSFAGVRALCDNRTRQSKDLSRDYLLQLDSAPHRAPLLSIYGGKLTAARHLAEKVLEQLGPFLPMTGPWTAESPLPGGDFDWKTFENTVRRACAQWKFLNLDQARRMVRAYGTRVGDVIGPAKKKEDLGKIFGADLTESEVRYLMQVEWAETADDVLWRRSKLGLRFSKAERQSLEAFMKAERGKA